MTATATNHSGWTPIPSHPHDTACPHLATDRGCYWCCLACNYAEHRDSRGRLLTHSGALKGQHRDVT